MHTNTALAFHIIYADGMIKSAEKTEKNRREKERHSNSNAAGRWLSAKALRSQTAIDNPIRSMAGRMAGAGLPMLAGAGVGVGAAHLTGGDLRDKIIAGGGGALSGLLLSKLLGTREAAQSVASQGLTEKGREGSLLDAHEGLEERSIGRNALHSAGKLALPAGLLGAGLGGLASAATAQPGESRLMRALAGAVTGGLASAAGGAVAGGIGGAVNSAVHKNTSGESHARAIRTLAKHPIRSALPGGDIYGALDK